MTQPKLSIEERSELEQLVQAIAPELPGCYVVERELYKGTQGGGCLAYQIDLHLGVRQQLVAQGRWRGPAPVIVVDVAATYQQADQSSMPRDVAVKSLAIHEAAHALPKRDLADVPIEPPQAWVDQKDAECEANLTQVLQPQDPWIHHGHSFVRRSLHLIARATAAGHQVAPGVVCGGIAYCLGPAWLYQAALGDEPERLADATFAEIEGTAPPPGWVAQIARDEAHWNQYRFPGATE